MTVARGATFTIQPRVDGLLYMSDIPTGNTGDAPYDLGVLPAFLDDLLWPAEPVLTGATSQDVSTIAELNAAMAIQGNEVFLRAGITLDPGNAIFTADDVQVNCPNDTWVNGGIYFSADTPGQNFRCAWINGNCMGAIRNNGCDDMFINNLNQLWDTGTAQLVNNFTGSGQGWNKVAIINTTLAIRGAGQWAFFNIQDDGVTRGNCILANVVMDVNPGQTVRFQSLSNFCVVDSFLNPFGTASNGIRIHGACRDHYMRDTQIVGTGVTGDNDNIVVGEWDNIDYYSTVNIHFTHPMTPTTGVVVRNSTAFFGGTPGTSTPLVNDAADGGGNIYAPWDGSNGSLPALPASAGADH